MKHRFWEDLECCLTRRVRIQNSPSLIDSRYFYFLSGTNEGRCTCGLAEMAGAKLMLIWNRRMDQRSWTKRWKEEQENPVVAGFHAERACIATIANGHHYTSFEANLQPKATKAPKGAKPRKEAIDPTDPFSRILPDIPFEVNMYSGTAPQYPFLNKTGPVAILWVPVRYNNPAVDAVLVVRHQSKLTKKNSKSPASYLARMFPIQITVAASHANSEIEFQCGLEQEWVKNIKCSAAGGNSSEFEFSRFIWIKPTVTTINPCTDKAFESDYTRLDCQCIDINAILTDH